MKWLLASMLLIVGVPLVGFVTWILLDLARALEPFGGLPWTWAFVSNFLSLNVLLPVMFGIGLILIFSSLLFISRLLQQEAKQLQIAKPPYPDRDRPY
jgi:hypothetical protein